MPTATDRDFLDMRVSDVRRVTRSGRDHHVVLLQEPPSGRRLPIWIGQETAIEIALRLLGHGPVARPLGSTWPPVSSTLSAATCARSALTA